MFRGDVMKKSAMVIAVVATFMPGFAVADSKVFPPGNEASCTGGSALTWDGETDVLCRTPQELLALALSKCPSGQTLVINAARNGLECKNAGLSDVVFARTFNTARIEPNCNYDCPPCRGTYYIETASGYYGCSSRSCYDEKECGYIRNGENPATAKFKSCPQEDHYGYECGCHSCSCSIENCNGYTRICRANATAVAAGVTTPNKNGDYYVPQNLLRAKCYDSYYKLGDKVYEHSECLGSSSGSCTCPDGKSIKALFDTETNMGQQLIKRFEVDTCQ